MAQGRQTHVSSLVLEFYDVCSQEKMSRRMSTSFLHNLLLRQHNDTRDESLDSRLSLDRYSDRGSSSELSTTSSSFSSVGTLQLREQLASVAQLVQYMQALVVSSSTTSSSVHLELPLPVDLSFVSFQTGFAKRSWCISHNMLTFCGNILLRFYSVL